MERRALVAEAFLAGAQRAEVLRRLRRYLCRVDGVVGMIQAVGENRGETDLCTDLTSAFNSITMRPI